jgi:hypothetical protein
LDARHGSVAIEDQSVIQAFEKNPNNTFLISFPRTGSHWLRMLMELYFGRPSLVRVFYYPECNDYLTLHTHDLELDVERDNVIYLYRDAVDTIYSQLRYHNEDMHNRVRIAYWADLYGRHLDKWLHKEKFTKFKTILRYEGLKTAAEGEFQKVCNHFSEPFDTTLFKSVFRRVSKEHVKEKTLHDRQVTNLSKKYSETREHFFEQQGEFVWQVLLNAREYLRQDF